MPYIPPESREGLSEPLDFLSFLIQESAKESPLYAAKATENLILYILTLGEVAAFDIEEAQEALQEVTGGCDHPVDKIVYELKARQSQSTPIGGAINFCISRLLVGVTKIHESARYEEKIQWIQERLESVRHSLTHSHHSGSGGLESISVLNMLGDHDQLSTVRSVRLSILQLVSIELYRRFGADYEDKKCRENGDIMD